MKRTMDEFRTEAGHAAAGYGFGGVIGLILLILLLMWIF